jgi:hypothetical protein
MKPTIPTPQEWLEQHERMHEKAREAWHEWAQHNQISRDVVQYVQDNPDVLEDVKPTDGANPYIFPQSALDYIINEKLHKE